MRAFVAKGMAVGAALGLATGAWAAYDGRAPVPPDAIPATVAQAALADEAQTPRRLGMTLSSEAEVELPRAHDDLWQMPLTIGAEECVAVVGVVWGERHLASIAIVDAWSRGRAVRLHDETPFDLVGQAQWCERTPQRRRVEIVAPSLERRDPGAGAAAPPRARAGTLRYMIFRGPWRTLGPHLRPEA